MHTHMHTGANTHAWTLTHTYTHACAHRYTHAPMYTCICTSVHLHTHTHPHTHAHMHKSTHIHSHACPKLFWHIHRMHRVRRNFTTKVKPRQYMDIFGHLQEQMDLGNLHFDTWRSSGLYYSREGRRALWLSIDFGVWWLEFKSWLCHVLSSEF